MSTELDGHGLPLNKAINARRNFVKSVESLIGLCRGLLADNHLSEDEVVYLDTWLKDNQHIVRSWSANVIADRVRLILADGVVTSDEAEDLKETLEKIIGGGLDETGGAVAGMSTKLPVNEIECIDFDGKLFCFTGRFMFGQRSKCEGVIKELGGDAVNGVTKKLDYLVIGTLLSRDWAHTSHGRKIEKAVGYRDQGQPLVIISEEDWVKYL